jgi:hypothetical protein
MMERMTCVPYGTSRGMGARERGGAGVSFLLKINLNAEPTTLNAQRKRSVQLAPFPLHVPEGAEEADEGDRKE